MASTRRGFVNIDDLPKIYTDYKKYSLQVFVPDVLESESESNTNPSAYRKSKNDIFNMAQKITKPAIKMSPEELKELRAGKTPVSDSDENDTSSSPPAIQQSKDDHKWSITVPVSFSYADQNVRSDPIDDITKSRDYQVPGAFLKMTESFNSSYPHCPQRQSSFYSTIGLSSATELSQHPETKIACRKSGASPQWFGEYDSLQLSFLPIKRNLIGEGRHSEVFRGYYRPTSKSFAGNDSSPCIDLTACAVKRMHSSEESLTLGLAEAMILRRLNGIHPNIITLRGIKNENESNLQNIEHHFCISQDWSTLSRLNVESASNLFPSKVPRLLLILDLHENGDLWNWIQRNKQRVSKSLWLKWAKELAGALREVHAAGVIHHDIKPQNILLTDFLDIRLSDFGNAAFVPEVLEIGQNSSSVSQISSEEDFSITNDTIIGPESDLLRNVPTSPSITPGSPLSPQSQSLQVATGRITVAYSAPELLQLETSYSFPIDVYSLGVTYYTLISGVDPFGLARSSTQLLLGIRRGFFSSGLQILGCQGYPGEGGIVGEPSDKNWRFLNGEVVPMQIVNLICNMLSTQPDNRPSAAAICTFLNALDV